MNNTTASIPTEIHELLATKHLTYLKTLKRPQSTGINWVLLVQAETSLWALKFSKHSLASEVRSMKGISHPQVVPLLDSGKTKQFSYLLTEFCPRGDLANFVEDATLLSEQHAAALFADLLEPVAYLHRRGMVHLDLKPENVVLTDDGRLSLIDFGHARADEDAARVQTKWNGSRKLNSPERFQPGAFNGFAADVYSLGVLLFYMLTKTYPFSEAKPTCAMFRKYMDDPRAFCEYFQRLSQELFSGAQPQWSESLLDLLIGMLNPDPCKRMKIEEVQYHPWVRRAGDHTTRSGDDTH